MAWLLKASRTGSRHDLAHRPSRNQHHPSDLHRLCRTALHPGQLHGTHCRRPAVKINPLAWSQHHVPFLHDPPPGQRNMKSSKRPGSFKETYARFKTYRKYRFFSVSVLPSSLWQNLTDLLLQQTAERRGWDEVKEAGLGLQ